ncbi:hypothetical protein [uncultured Algimonas sp.]|uniref:hypothetical protein n=1 Tax=uncultured Algimonas sp. TaxID=1547920 RepID=UPI00260E8F48|nr:hypothetical protein [uncultured Algimonas sp.]
MDDLYLSAEVGGRTVCVSPLSKTAYNQCGGKGLGGDYGYFVYEYDSQNSAAGIEVLAKARSTEAALRIFDLLTRKPILN